MRFYSFGVLDTGSGSDFFGIEVLIERFDKIVKDLDKMSNISSQLRLLP